MGEFTSGILAGCAAVMLLVVPLSIGNWLARRGCSGRVQWAAALIAFAITGLIVDPVLR